MSSPNINLIESESEVVASMRVSAYTAAMTVSDRIRARLRDEMDARDLSQEDLAILLSRRTKKVWSQSKVAKYLTGRVDLKIEGLNNFAECLGISLAELVRDPGLEFYAEMTPTELRLFHKIRRNPKWMDAILVLAGLPITPPTTETPVELPAKKKRGGPLNSASTQEEKEAWPPEKKKTSKVSQTAQTQDTKKP